MTDTENAKSSQTHQSRNIFPQENFKMYPTTKKSEGNLRHIPVGNVPILKCSVPTILYTNDPDRIKNRKEING